MGLVARDGMRDGLVGGIKDLDDALDDAYKLEATTDGERAQRCVTDISTSGGTSGSGPTPLLSEKFPRHSWGELSEDWDTSDDDTNPGGIARHPLGATTLSRGDLAKWPPPARRFGGGAALRGVPPGSLPEWHPVEADTPSDDDRLWATSCSSANESPGGRATSCSSANEACSRRNTSQGFCASSALASTSALADSFGDFVLESTSSFDLKPRGQFPSAFLKKVSYRGGSHGSMLQDEHPSKHRRSRRLPGRRRWGKEPTLHIMESCSEAVEASEEAAKGAGSGGLLPTKQRLAGQDGAAQLAGAAAAAMEAGGGQQQKGVVETLGFTFVSFVTTLFDTRPASGHGEGAALEEAGSSSTGGGGGGAVVANPCGVAEGVPQLNAAYWCEADALSPSDDEEGWEKSIGQLLNSRRM